MTREAEPRSYAQTTYRVSLWFGQYRYFAVVRVCWSLLTLPRVCLEQAFKPTVRLALI